MIERLKQAQAEDSENDDPDSLTGEEDEEAATGINVWGSSIFSMFFVKLVYIVFMILIIIKCVILSMVITEGW